MGSHRLFCLVCLATSSFPAVRHLPSLGGLDPGPLLDLWGGTAFRGPCWSPGLFRWEQQISWEPKTGSQWNWCLWETELDGCLWGALLWP